MKLKVVHAWDVTPKEAVDIQTRLKSRLGAKPGKLEKIERIAAVDASYSKKNKQIFAAAVTLSYPALDILDEQTVTLVTSFPYLPGLLAFREGPAMIKALEQVELEPDLLMFDGQGIAHPRGMGIATHLGILFEKPSLGVAKTILTGEYEEPPNKAGSYSFLKAKNRGVVGAVLRTRSEVRPVFVSVGFGIGLNESLGVVANCLRGYRLPEPLRLAHLLSNRARLKTEA